MRHAAAIDRSGYLFVAFFTVPSCCSTSRRSSSASIWRSPSGASSGAPTWVGLANFREALADDWVANAFLNTLRYALIIVPGVTVLGLLFALFVHQRWPLATAGARPVLHAQRRLGDGDRPGLGLAARYPVRPGQPVSGHDRHPGRPLADLGRLVADRRLHRLDLVGPGPRLRHLPGGAPGRAARPARGGRHRRRRPAAPVLARDPAPPAPGDQHGGDPAADRVAAHLQPGLRHDQRRPGRSLAVGHPLHLPDRHRPVPAGLRLRRLHAAVRADPGTDHPAAAGAAGACRLVERLHPRHQRWPGATCRSGWAAWHWPSPGARRSCGWSAPR